MLSPPSCSYCGAKNWVCRSRCRAADWYGANPYDLVDNQGPQPIEPNGSINKVATAALRGLLLSLVLATLFVLAFILGGILS